MINMGHNHESAAEIRANLRKERVKDGMPFSLLWQWELVCSDATPSEKYVGLVLRLFGDADGSNNAPAIRTLSAATGVAKSTVEAALAGRQEDGRSCEAGICRQDQGLWPASKQL